MSNWHIKETWAQQSVTSNTLKPGKTARHHCCDVADLFWKSQVDWIFEQALMHHQTTWWSFPYVISITSRNSEFTLLIRYIARAMSINDNCTIQWCLNALTILISKLILIEVHNIYCDSIKAEHNFELCSWWDYVQLLFGSMNIFSHCAISAGIQNSISRVWTMCL